MSDNTGIQWTNTTWNPVVGCRAVSAGCAHCYAETMSVRLAGMAVADEKAGKNPGRKAHYLHVINNGGWRGNVELVPEALVDPLKWKRPRKVFVNSMSDLFYGDEADRRACASMGIPFEPVPFEFIDKVMAVINATSTMLPIPDDVTKAKDWHVYQLLTKRAGRMAEYFTSRHPRNFKGSGNHPIFKVRGELFRGWGGENMNAAACLSWPLPNLWLGVSVENQKAADERIPALLKCPAVVRFLSCEPLLGPLELETPGRYRQGIGRQYLSNIVSPFSDQRVLDRGIQWVIVGGESGAGARPFNVDWARSIVGQCKAAGVACFVKQLGANVQIPDDPNGEPTGLRCRRRDDGSWYAVLHDRKGGSPDEWPEDLRVREFPKAVIP